MRPLLAALLLALAAPAVAEPAFTPGSPADDNVIVARILDGETLQLADGRILRLVDIDVPPRSSTAAAAKTALAGLIDGQRLVLKFAGNPQDRRGRVLAELFAGDLWVQGELLRRGLARVAGTAVSRAGITEMLALERQARRYRRGLWADADGTIVPAAEAGRHAGGFALVSGRVEGSASNAQGVVLYLGADRRDALALTFAPDVVRLCRDAGLNPAALEGEMILTRGYIDDARQPRIAVTFPEQIELLRAHTKKKAAPKSLPGPPS